MIIKPSGVFDVDGLHVSVLIIYPGEVPAALQRGCMETDLDPLHCYPGAQAHKGCGGSQA
jgi:hypothetical protein